MAQVIVVFPKKADPIVVERLEAAEHGALINWHVHCENSKVKKVRIDFKEDDANFFPINGTSRNWFEKVIGKQTTIWGKAPIFEKFPRSDKYTIKGLDADGKQVCELDPRIITDQPGP